MDGMLEYALKYAKLGWKIFPLVPGQKVPITKHGVKDATSNEKQIREWWVKWPRANIAVACGKDSGVYVIDVDVEESTGVNGLKSLKEFSELPKTICQDTPRGGFHAFYYTDDPPVNRNDFRPGIDIRGNGYYVVLAPSVHPNGGTYKWTNGCSPWEIQASQYPDFMRPATKAPWLQPATAPISVQGFDVSDLSRRASFYLAECNPAIQGQGGHNALLWAATALIHGFLLTDDQALDLLTREYNPRCIPPWDFSISKDEKDFRRKISEARRLTPQKPRGWLLEDDSYKAIDSKNIISKDDIARLISNSHNKSDISLTIELARSSELDFLTCPTGLLGEICSWINATAIKQQPVLTLACAIAFCGALFGRKIRDKLGSRTNLYCMGIASSSAGKAHAPNQIRKICEASGCIDLLGGDDVTSDSAIEHRMERFPASLFLWDEIGFLLSYIKSGISQHHARIVPLLMKLYSSSGSVYKGKEYADVDNQATIIQPCCCIYGTSTPQRFTEGISPEELQDGWLSRCLVFRTYSDPAKNRSNCDAPIPKHLIEQITAWYNRVIGLSGGNITNFVAYRGSVGVASIPPPEQIVVQTDSDAEKIFIAFDNEAIIYGKSNPHLACLWNKGEENARRIALIVAASESFDSPKITISIADYACRLIRYFLTDFGKATVTEIVTCSVDSKKQKLLRVIEKAGADGCIKRDITRGSQWTNTKDRMALLSDLIEAEEIIAQAKGKTMCFWTVENYRKYLEK